MKSTVVYLPEKVISDTAVRRAIEYLDSSSDYREVFPRQQRIETTSRRRARIRRTDVDDLVLVFVPFLLVGIAIVAVCWK
jgi:hypothetical protein